MRHLGDGKLFRGANLDPMSFCGSFHKAYVFPSVAAK
jgi:hypothetical protein